MISWDDPNWGHNPVHHASNGSWGNADEVNDQ